MMADKFELTYKSHKINILLSYMSHMQYQDSFPNIMSLNILEFVSKYSLSQNELVDGRASEVIIKTFPTYNSDPKGKKLYCKYQLHKFKPWQTSTECLR